jgi:hypothetical protein
MEELLRFIQKLSCGGVWERACVFSGLHRSVDSKGAGESRLATMPNFRSLAFHVFVKRIGQ